MRAPSARTSGKIFTVNRGEGVRLINGTRIRSREEIDAAKASICIREAWLRLGAPGDPSKALMPSPLREDKHPSFGISDSGRFFRDFATGEFGDVVSFIQRLKKCSANDAISTLIKMAGLERVAVDDDSLSKQKKSSITAKKTAPKAEKPLPRLPSFSRFKEDDILHIAALRKLSSESIRLADEMGILRRCVYGGAEAWVVTDAFARNAQARRLDGKPWGHVSSTPKCLTLRGSWASWPVGLSAAEACPGIALVEGGPDILAAAHFIFAEHRRGEIAPVGILGAGTSIHAEALRYFKGKTVRIFKHCDDSGSKAAIRWQQQLDGIASSVDIFDVSKINPKCKDLNDLASHVIANLMREVQVLPRIIKEGIAGELGTAMGS